MMLLIYVFPVILHSVRTSSGKKIIITGYQTLYVTVEALNHLMYAGKEMRASIHRALRRLTA